MSEPISVGDLVIVVHPSRCSGRNHNLGLIFTVIGVKRGGEIPGKCFFCGGDHPEDDFAPFAEAPDGWFPFSRLRRIPPLTELDEAERKIEEPI